MCQTEDVEEDPDYDESEALSIHPPVVSQPSANTLLSKNGKFLQSVSLDQQARLNAANVIKMVPGPARYAVSHV